MSDRHEIAAIISAGDADVDPLGIADAILAAGYRRPRTITTAQELDALPWEAVMRDVFGDVYSARGHGTFWAFGDDDSQVRDEIVLPATVLFEGLDDE